MKKYICIKDCGHLIKTNDVIEIHREFCDYQQDFIMNVFKDNEGYGWIYETQFKKYFKPLNRKLKLERILK